MKYLLIIIIAFTGTSCVRLPLNVYSVQPVNTTVVKDDGDAGINVSYFSDEPKHAGERNLFSNGMAVQGRAALYNKWFMETSFSFLTEVTDGEFNANNNRTINNFQSTAKHSYKEIGIGKILDLNKKGNNKVLLSVGYGYTKYKNAYEIISPNKVELADFNFNNNHLFFNAQFQFDFGIFAYQVGLKDNLINFRNVNTNNNGVFGEEVSNLQNNVRNFQHSAQLFQDFGIFPIKNNKWLSVHAGFSFSNGVYFLDRFKSRTVGGNLSIMANPSKLFKKK
jgi:hypothetical protein